MSMSIAASADGTTFTLLMGATIIGTFSARGITAGTLLATAAEAQSYSNNTKLLTPSLLDAAFQGGNQFLAIGGYQKLPGDLIIQWGGATSSGTASNNVTITFPTSFPTACLHTVGSITGIGGLSPYTLQVGSYTVSTAYMTTLQNSAIATGIGIRWIAIGY